MSSGIYLDENRCDRRLTQQLREAGLLVVRVADVGMEGREDADQLEFAAANELTIYTENGSDFIPLHWKWMVAERHHSGVIILSPEFGLGEQLRRTLRLWRELAGAIEDRIEFLRDWPAPRA